MPDTLMTKTLKRRCYRTYDPSSVYYLNIKASLEITKYLDKLSKIYYFWSSIFFAPVDLVNNLIFLFILGRFFQQ